MPLSCSGNVKADSDHTPYSGFYINLPVGGGVAVLLFLLRIPEPVQKPPVRQVFITAIKSLDLPGFMLISPAAIMFLLGLQYGGNQYAWNSSVVIGLLVGAGVLFALFLVWEYRQGDGAMVPFAMLKHRIIWSAAGNLFFLLGSILVADFYLAIYFQAIHNDSPLMSGVHMLPTTIGMVLFTMTSGMMSMFSAFRAFWLLKDCYADCIGTTQSKSLATISHGLLGGVRYQPSVTGSCHCCIPQPLPRNGLDTKSSMELAAAQWHQV